MNEKQRRFVDYYIETGNATQAYERVYGAKGSARGSASRLLTKDNVSAEITKRLSEIRSAKIADVNETLEIVTSILRGETFEKIAMSVGNDKSSRVEVVEVPARIRDRLKAAEYLLKIYGAFREQNNESNVPTTIKIISAEKKSGIS